MRDCGSSSGRKTLSMPRLSSGGGVGGGGGRGKGGARAKEQDMIVCVCSSVCLSVSLSALNGTLLLQYDFSGLTRKMRT